MPQAKGALFFSSYFTFHPLLLYKNYCYCTLHVNTVPNWWLQAGKYLFKAGANLLPFPFFDLKAFFDSPGRKTQVSAGELQLSQRGIMLFAFRTDFYQLCPSCFDPVTCGCSLTGLVYACLLPRSKWENLSRSDCAVTFFHLTADWSDMVLVTQTV